MATSDHEIATVTHEMKFDRRTIRVNASVCKSVCV